MRGWPGSLAPAPASTPVLVPGRCIGAVAEAPRAPGETATLVPMVLPLPPCAPLLRRRDDRWQVGLAPARRFVLPAATAPDRGTPGAAGTTPGPAPVLPR